MDEHIPAPTDEHAPMGELVPIAEIMPSGELVPIRPDVPTVPAPIVMMDITHRSNLLIERELLSACLVDDSAMRRMRRRLEPHHLAGHDHKLLWNAMVKCWDRKGMIDHPIVATIMTNEHGVAAGQRWVRVIFDRYGSVSSVDTYLHEILACWSVRQGDKMLKNISDLMEDPAMQANDRIGAITRLIENHKSACSIEDTDSSAVGEAIGELLASINTAKAAVSEGRAVSFESGWSALDAICKPRRSNLLAIMATRGQGKSSLAVNGYVVQACKAGMRCAVYSTEMSAGQIMGRIVAGGSGVTYSEQTSGKMTGDKPQRVMDTAMAVGNWPLHIVHEPRWSIDRIAAHAQQLAQEHGGLDVVVVDYVQMVKNPPLDGVANLDHTSRTLKVIASELNCLVIGISQPTASASRTGVRPRMSDAKGSGSIPDDADLFLVVWRPDGEGSDGHMRESAEAHLDKAREGQAGTMATGTFRANRMRFEDAQWRDRR